MNLLLNTSHVISNKNTYCVIPTEPAWERHLQDVTLKEGQTCTMTCQFSVPNVKSEWFRNGRILKPQGRYKTEVEHKVHKLTIADVRAEDQGRYTCKHEDLETSAELRIEGGWKGMAGVITASVRGKCYAQALQPCLCMYLKCLCELISQHTHSNPFTHVSKSIQNQKGSIPISADSFL